MSDSLLQVGGTVFSQKLSNEKKMKSDLLWKLTTLNEKR